MAVERAQGMVSARPIDSRTDSLVECPHQPAAKNLAASVEIPYLLNIPPSLCIYLVFCFSRRLHIPGSALIQKLAEPKIYTWQRLYISDVGI